jgi:DNA repair exonuclease SbcCD ATPase subunit
MPVFSKLSVCVVLSLVRINAALNGHSKDFDVSGQALSSLLDKDSADVNDLDQLQQSISRETALIAAMNKHIQSVEEAKSHAELVKEESIATLHGATDGRLIQAKAILSHNKEELARAKSHLTAKTEELATIQAEVDRMDESEKATKKALSELQREVEQDETSQHQALSSLQTAKFNFQEQEIGDAEATQKLKALKSKTAEAESELSQQAQSRDHLIESLQKDKAGIDLKFATEKAILDHRIAAVKARKDKAEARLLESKDALKAWKASDQQLKADTAKKVERYHEQVKQFNLRRSKVLQHAGAQVAEKIAKRNGFDDTDWAWSDRSESDVDFLGLES